MQSLLELWDWFKVTNPHPYHSIGWSYYIDSMAMWRKTKLNFLPHVRQWCLEDCTATNCQPILISLGAFFWTLYDIGARNDIDGKWIWVSKICLLDFGNHVFQYFCSKWLSWKECSFYQCLPIFLIHSQSVTNIQVGQEFVPCRTRAINGQWGLMEINGD